MTTDTIIGTLPPAAAGNYVTFKSGKRAIRTIIRQAGLTGVKTFRPRRENKNEFMIPVTGGHVIASRKVGANVVFRHITLPAQ